MKIALTLATLLATPAALAAPTVKVAFNFQQPTGTSPVGGLLKQGNDYIISLLTGGRGGQFCFYGQKQGGRCGAVMRLSPPNAQHATWQAKDIYRFQRAPDGSFPSDEPTPHGQGNLFLTTTSGGAQGTGGTIVELTPPQSGANDWTEQVLYSFGAGLDIGRPLSGVHVDSSGNLFVGAEEGGTYRLGGVAELSPPKSGQGAWTYSVIHEFDGNDGGNPISGILSDAQNNLYLTTYSGYAYGGSVVELSPPPPGQSAWTETLLHGFNGGPNDGLGPSNGLVRDSSGSFYGLTDYGGPANVGVAYKLTPPTGGGTQWGFQLLYSFTGGADGGTPSRGLAIDAAGNVFATTTAGGDPTCQCGTLVKLTPPQSGQGPYTETTLHAFTGTPDGAQPSAITVEDNGNLLIPTAAGGQYNGGALIEVTNSGFATRK